MNPKRYIFLLTVLWFAALSVSLVWNVHQTTLSARAEHLQAARSFFQQVLITRSWNAQHGGLYLKVTEDLQPNPYLEAPDRDIVTTDGLELTKVNPAFMTRMISEIAEEQGDITFHITSLRPINPTNKPDGWEEKGLMILESGKLLEFSEYQEHEDQQKFRYLAPLITDKSCLQCHATQGYQEGDIRGGISVSFPVQPRTNGTLIISHLLLMLGGLVLIIGFGKKIIDLTNLLRRQSHVDGLTQVANRKYFDISLQREWLRCRRLNAPLSLVMCDIDYFKLYNDTYGHQAGDECLRKVARTLDRVINRPTDMLARYGGEEFAVILPDTSVDGAVVVAEMMQAAVEKKKILHSASKTGSYVTVSFGVTTMEEQFLTKEELIQQADRALYFSKEKGRNIVTHAGEI